MVDEPDIMLTYLDSYHAAAVMRAISAWARFEYAIDEMIWRFLGVENPNWGACVTSQLTNANARLDALIALSETRGFSAKHVLNLRGIARDSHGPREKRNRLVHDPWFYGAETKKHYRLEQTAKKRLDHTYKEVSEQEIDAITAEIEALAERLGQANSQMLEEYYKLPLS